MEIRCRNVAHALPEGIRSLKELGTENPSRDGRVLEMDEPVMTIYERPLERVLCYPDRDANPFFHFFESLWMLAGRDDVEYVQEFNNQIANYSDNGKNFHGAYGYRWRRWFNFDQLNRIIIELTENPLSRRAVLAIWDPLYDLGRKGKDLPCNTAVYFKIREGKLKMTVVNRSNDIIWGAYGANAVHFSFLQEYLAGQLFVGVGEYAQVSDNYHAYLDKGVWEKCIPLISDVPIGLEPYRMNDIKPYPLYAGVNNWARKEFLTELSRWMDDPFVYDSIFHFFQDVAKPLLRAWRLYKTKNHHTAIDILNRDCVATDWRKAGVEWIQRRIK